MIRLDDRADYRESVPDHQIRIYYINVNSKSPIHHHSLILVLHGGTYVAFDEWEGENLISSTPAEG